MAEAVAQVTAATQLRREEKPIRGKVAAVLDENRLVLNVGTDHGVAPNMVFKIIETRTIRDPDTGDELGKVDVTKTRTLVGKVEERMSIAYPRSAYDDRFFSSILTRQKFKSDDIQHTEKASRVSDLDIQYIEVAVGDLALSD